MVAVGLEELGVEEFVAGKFFDGELYIDTKKECYQQLGFKRFNFFNLIPSLFKKTSRDAVTKSREEKISGNMAGDGMQNGGSIIVAAGGTEQLLFYKQEQPAEHVALVDVLKALSIDEAPPSRDGSPKVTCNEDACTRS